MMAGRILFFGRLKDATGVDGLPLTDTGLTLSDLRKRLCVRFPEAAPLLASRAVRVALNRHIVGEEETVQIADDDEVAFMPPLSGG